MLHLRRLVALSPPKGHHTHMVITSRALRVGSVVSQNQASEIKRQSFWSYKDWQCRGGAAVVLLDIRWRARVIATVGRQTPSSLGEGALYSYLPSWTATQSQGVPCVRTISTPLYISHCYQTPDPQLFSRGCSVWFYSTILSRKFWGVQMRAYFYFLVHTVGGRANISVTDYSLVNYGQHSAGPDV